MKILFDTALDGRGWPAWEKGESAILGEIRVGRLGLLGILETMLGVQGPGVIEGVRVASLVQHVQNIDGFWSASAKVDPFGVTHEVIKFYDFLCIHGWELNGGAPRLDDLARLSGLMTPGIPQRIRTVLKGLEAYNQELPELTLLETTAGLPLLWKRLFEELAKKGAPVRAAKIELPKQFTNDLYNSRSKSFAPIQDGSLQLYRPTGTLQAAEEVAAWLAAVGRESNLEDTVIVGGDAVLDRALHRFGLPVTGAEPEKGNSLLQVLPLILSCGWNPPDPARVMELLTLPASPVPSLIGRRLIGALERWPAVGSPLWQEKLDEGLSQIKEESDRKRVADRLKTIFKPINGKEYPASEIAVRIDMLDTWLHGRFKDDPVAAPALAQCAILAEIVRASGQESFSEPFLKKLVDEASSVSPASSLASQYGLAAISAPEAALGRAKRIIWWNFTGKSVSAFTRPLLSLKEREILTEAGAELPDSATITSNQAERWSRPLHFAEQQLLLVCPEVGGDGEELHPHPLWFELLARSDGKAEMLVQKKILHTLAIPTSKQDSLALPVAEESWQVVPGSITKRDKESPSSLENFLGCPLNWSFSYQARIRRGNVATLPNMVPTLGSLAHELLEEVISQDPLPEPDHGATSAGKLFNERAPLLVAQLYQEGQEGEQEKIRNTVIMATRSLLQHFKDAGVTKLTVEQHLQGQFKDQPLQGWADVVVDDPFTVVDLKRSYSKFFKKKMTKGTALQIVIYGWLLKQSKGVFPELSYFTLEDQTFLTTNAHHFPNGDEVQTPSNDDIWRAFEQTWEAAWKKLTAGQVACTGIGEDVEAELSADRLVMQPPCRFCDYDVLCGRRLI